MPIYEFRCTECDKKFEKLCKMGQKDGVTCPDCGEIASSLFSTFYAHGGSSSGGHSGGCGCGGSCGGGCGGNCGGNCSNCSH